MAEWTLRGIWAAVLFTLQLKKLVINILLIVVCRFSDAKLHLNGLFIETVRESISLSALMLLLLLSPYKAGKGAVHMNLQQLLYTELGTSTWATDNTKTTLKETSPCMYAIVHAQAHTLPSLDVPLGCNWEQGGPQQINKTYWFSVIWLSGCHNGIIGQDQCVCAQAPAIEHNDTLISDARGI